jgi:hypothetical protein
VEDRLPGVAAVGDVVQPIFDLDAQGPCHGWSVPTCPPVVNFPLPQTPPAAVSLLRGTR